MEPPRGMGINGGITAPGAGFSGGGGVEAGWDPEAENTQLVESWKQFSDQPQHKEALAKHQASEMRKAGRLQRKMRAQEFKEKVLESGYEAQQNVAPFLDNRVLRRIVNTFCNDPRNDFEKWACNPRIIGMLQQMKDAMDEGRMTEDEAEHVIRNFLSDPSQPAHEEFKHKTKQVARLDTEHLVGALNETLEHRRRGNQLYGVRRFREAMQSYEKALSITNFVVGMSSADQREIDTNKVAVLLNMSAVDVALKDYGAAVRRCSEALEIEPQNVKALLRRAKAHAGRRNHEDAAADLEAVKDLEPWNYEAEEEMRRLKAMRKQDYQEDVRLAQNVFKEGREDGVGSGT